MKFWRNFLIVNNQAEEYIFESFPRVDVDPWVVPAIGPLEHYL